MRHHLYVCEAESRELARHRVFRNFLRANPDQANAYGELKQRLVAQFLTISMPMFKASRRL